MVWEVKTVRLVPLLTPLFFGWTISLSNRKKLALCRKYPLLIYFFSLLEKSFTYSNGQLYTQIKNKNHYCFWLFKA
jgi:hypothetical protein